MKREVRQNMSTQPSTKPIVIWDLHYAFPHDAPFYDRDGFSWIRNETSFRWICPGRGLKKSMKPGEYTEYAPFTTERKTAVATIERTKVKARVKELEDLLEAAREALSEATPVEPTELGAVVRFKKFGYTYAALKVERLVGTQWYLTQNPTRSQDRKLPKTWAELLDFIGERNWDSIEELFA
jgi:hypothetical protein